VLLLLSYGYGVREELDSILFTTAKLFSKGSMKMALQISGRLIFLQHYQHHKKDSFVVYFMTLSVPQLTKWGGVDIIMVLEGLRKATENQSQ
jgi:hypothetical protein